MPSGAISSSMPNLPRDESPYWVESSLEIKQILKNVAKSGERVVLWFGQGSDDFIVSVILEARDDAIIMDHGVDERLNAKLLNSETRICSTCLDRVDILFEIDSIKSGQYDGSGAFYAKYPDKLHKLQRREFYRVMAPIAKPVYCSFSVPDDKGKMVKVQSQVLDLSLGGLCVLNPDAKLDLKGKEVFKSVAMDLPEFGQVAFDLEICHVFDITSPNGSKKKRAGCRFLKLSLHDQNLIQRYIAKLERDRRNVSP